MSGEMLTRAIVRASIAPLQQEARVASPQVSQLLRGHTAHVLQRTGQWAKLRGADDYEGWCHMGYLTVDSAPAIGLVSPVWENDVRISLGCTIRQSDGMPLTLPVGAVLDAQDEVIAGIAMNRRARKRYFVQSGENIVQRAHELFWGTPYQWGGVTPWGADCSGFVQTIFALSGVLLPRDAWQQGECGVRVDDAANELRPGDLVFFSDRDDGRITHVAVSGGGTMLVHSSLANGGFGINYLDGDDRVSTTLRAMLRWAVRVL